MSTPDPQALRPVPPDGPPRAAPPEAPRPPWLAVALSTVVMVLFLVYQARVTRGGDVGAVDYTQLYAWVQAGKVQKVTIEGREVTGSLKAAETVAGGDVTEFRATLPVQEDRDLLPLLREKQVDVVAASDASPFTSVLVSLLPWGLILGAWWWFSRRAAQSLAGASGGALGGLTRSRSRRFEPQEDVRVRFDDVAGLLSAKSDLKEVVDFLREPAKFQKLGGSCRAASCSSGLRGRARRSSRARSPVRRVCPSST
jgi:cell division protease FtsH